MNRGRGENMPIKERIEERWNESAQGYDSYIQGELNTFKENAWTELILKDEKRKQLRILDIGTGPGFFSVILSKQGHQVTGIDCTENMVEVAKKNAIVHGVDPKFYVMDSHKLDFEDNSFDLIVSRNVTWTLYNPDNAYKEWRRVLKPEGKLMIFDANWQLFYFDEELKMKVEKAQSEYRKKYGEPFESCDEPMPDEFYMSLPLSSKLRPEWDKHKLEESGYKNIKIDTDIIDKVYDEKEMLLYGCTPSFKIVATK
jgi:ubiquinone/menaquinone biosynthesis C-methylase UbiE